MTVRAGNWVIFAGAIGMFLGVCCLPAAAGGNGDPTLLAVAATIFALGGLTLASGIYLKAKVLSQEHVADEEALRARRARGGCELCASDVPVIQCRVHQLHLCSTCLEAHYDARSCNYIPPARRSASKGTNRLAKAHGA